MDLGDILMFFFMCIVRRGQRKAAGNEAVKILQARRFER